MKMALMVAGLALVGLGLSRTAFAADVGGSGGALEREPLGVAEARALVDLVNAERGGWHDPADVLAIIEIESSFRPDAYRPEVRLNDASRGLMQILLSTARDRGFAGEPGELNDPLTNVRYGMAQLEWTWEFLRSRLGRDPSAEQWIGAYNAGVGNVLRGYVPMGYVNRWLAARSRYV